MVPIWWRIKRALCISPLGVSPGVQAPVAIGCSVGGDGYVGGVDVGEVKSGDGVAGDGMVGDGVVGDGVVGDGVVGDGRAGEVAGGTARTLEPRDAAPQLEVRDPAGVGLRAAIARVPAQAQKTVNDVVRLLAAVVRRLRLPLLLVAAAPLLPAVVLIVASAVRGGSDVPLAYVVAVLLLIPSAWLELRRRQLLAALQPPEQAGAEIYAIVGAPEFWMQLRSNLGELTDLGRGLGLRSLGRRLWQGIKLTNAVRERVGENSRLAPFLPGRLRGLLMLTVACGVAGALLTVLAVLKVLTAAVGIG